MPTMILKCNCRSAYQDGVYGEAMRAHNQTAKPGDKNTWRCTVCQKEQLHGSGKKDEKAEKAAEKEKKKATK